MFGKRSCEGENGAGDGIRTRDINLGKVALYQLSYSRMTPPDFLASEKTDYRLLSRH